MTSTENMTNHTVAVFETHDQAADAIKELNKDGYDIKKLSIIGQNYASDEHVVGFVNTGDRMWSWGKLGAFWGYIWGLLFGSAMFFVPGVGFLVFAGWLVGALESAVVVGGLAALGGALASIGTPHDSVVKYETALKAGSFLVLAHGTEAEVARAKALLETTTATHIDTFSTNQVAVAH
jgi:hypothetical protein